MYENICYHLMHGKYVLPSNVQKSYFIVECMENMCYHLMYGKYMLPSNV